MTKQLFSLLVLTAVLGAPCVLAAESPVGKWNTVDDKTGKVKSNVEMYEQDGKLFGKIIGLPDPNDKQGNPKTCTACKGADKDKPIVGLVIVKGLSLSGERYKGGTVLDPEDGEVYKAEVWVEKGKLKLRGYYGVLYRTQTWVKAN